MRFRAARRFRGWMSARIDVNIYLKEPVVPHICHHLVFSFCRALKPDRLTGGRENREKENRERAVGLVRVISLGFSRAIGTTGIGTTGIGEKRRPFSDYESYQHF